MTAIKTVTVTIEGGVIQNIEAPPGVRVVVMDFDTEGVEPTELTLNAQGEAYVRSVWGPGPE